MTDLPLAELWIAAACVLLGAFVAGAEAALTSLSSPRLRALQDELGPDRGRALARYVQDPANVHTRLLALRVTALIAASILATNAMLRARAPGWQVLALTCAIAIAYGAVAEACSTLGRARARSIAPRLLSITRPLEFLITPVAAPLRMIGRAIEARVKLRQSDEPPVTAREVEYVVEEAESSGGLDRKRGQMLQNVLELKDVTARDVMVPRTRVHAIDVSTPLERARALVIEEGHSRVPVYRGQIDNMVGVLHVKDLFRALQRLPQVVTPGEEITLEDIARKPTLMVPVTQSALTVLRDMQARQTHLAMVVDEFGAVVGIVTLEDVLEELVGDIQDEHDADEATIQNQGNGRYLVAATMPIHDLGEYLGVEFPETATYSSLGGFLAQRAGRVPSVGTTVEWGGYSFIVREGDERRATRVEAVRTRRSELPPGDVHAAE